MFCEGPGRGALRQPPPILRTLIISSLTIRMLTISMLIIRMLTILALTILAPIISTLTIPPDVNLVPPPPGVVLAVVYRSPGARCSTV